MGDIKLIDLGNVGDLAKPATMLIEKVSSIFEPYQIRRLAKAEEKAKLIELEGEIKRNEMTGRALNRFVAEESRKQANIESIIKKAIPQLTEKSKPGEINNDWLFNFLDKCKTISEDEMQEIWARILSGEANKPGSFSRRTINALNSIEQNEAYLFTNFCSFCWESTIGEIQFPLIYNLKDKIYTNKGINFNILNHLDDIGLISFTTSPTSEYHVSYLHEDVYWKYSDKEFYLNFNDMKHVKITVGHAIFTFIGHELADICRPKPVDGFIEYVSAQLKEQNISMIEL